MGSEHTKERRRALERVAEHGWRVIDVSPRRGYTAAAVRRAAVASGLVTTLLPASGGALPTAVPGGTGSALRVGRGPELVAV